jgi:response regulator RpfG family c-di-GMP phosphodiesterase
MHAPPVTVDPSSAPPRAALVSVLVVDDEDTVRQVLVRWLESAGYSVTCARSADEAVVRLDTTPAAVVLCDIRMPGHDGLWLARRIRHHFPETAVIVSSGVHDAEAAKECERQGVVDYLIKPFGRDRLREAVSRAIDWHTAAGDARRWRETLQREMDDLSATLQHRLHDNRIANDKDLDRLLIALPGRRSEICEHSRRVAALCRDIVAAPGSIGPDLQLLRRAALLHDVGKLALPDAIVRKPAPLTAEEQALVRLVPQLTREMLSGIPFLAPAAPIVGAVYERMDGHGYPDGLRGNGIALESRIIAVADAYDTMTHARVYRDALTPREARLELERCAGTQFDPAVVTALDRALATHPSVD